MKFVPLFGLLLFPVVAFGKDTAYQALRLISSERDKALLNRVIEVKGTYGTPQPESWVILLDDPAARGGVREIEVGNSKVISERTPMNSAGSATAINFQKLNLDSPGAFTVAEQTARSSKIGFDAVNYSLKRDETTGTPVWVLELVDADKRAVGSVTIAAETGVIISKDLVASRAAASRGTDGSDDQADQEEATAGRDGERVGVKAKIKETVKGTAKDVGHTINKTFHKVGGSLESFFTGKRTVDREYRD